MRNLLLLICLLISWVVPLSSPAQSNIYIPSEADLDNKTERIIDFHADINIKTDGKISVTEYITVYVDNKDILRGVIRNIPESRTDSKGKIRQLPVEVISLKRNDQSSEYSLRSAYVGKNLEEQLIYTGSSETILEKGVHQYELVYETSSNVGNNMRGHVTFFDEYAELFWNVMGGESVYEFERASATVHLPGGVAAIQWSCYTGVPGSTEQAYECDGNISMPTFRVSRALKPGEGFSVAVAFPRDVIAVPTEFEIRLEDNINRINGVMYIVILFIIMFIMWLAFGRGARVPTIIPQFSAPNGWSAEKVSYLYNQRFVKKTFTVAILQMAVRNAIGIECGNLYKGDNTYFLTNNSLKTHDDNGQIIKKKPLSNEQQSIFAKLFSYISFGSKEEKGKKIELGKHNEIILTEARNSLEESIKKIIPIERLYTVKFVCNKIVLVIIIIFYLLYAGNYNFDVDEFSSFFLMPIILLAMLIIFVYKMRRLTPFGAKVKAELEGLKMYIGKAEKRRLNVMTPPKKTPEHFEEMLPYAVALGVENKWCDKFHDVLKRCDYKPSWYSDSDLDMSNISHTISHRVIRSVNSSVVSSSSYKKPVSFSSSSSSSSGSRSSGSSGGGYSGGGGGGGGIRGW